MFARNGRMSSCATIESECPNNSQLGRIHRTIYSYTNKAFDRNRVIREPGGKYSFHESCWPMSSDIRCLPLLLTLKTNEKQISLNHASKQITQR